MTPADLLVVGDGVVALSIALESVRRHSHARVVVFGGGSTRPSASAASGAMLGVFGEVAAPIASTEPGRKKLALALEARDLWPAWIDLLNDGVDGERVRIASGTEVITNTKSGVMEDGAFRSICASLDAHQEPYEDLTDARDGEFDVPAYARPTRRLFLPREGFVPSGGVLSLLRRQLARRSVTITEAPSAINHRSDGFHVTAGGEEYVAPAMVIAAGAWTTELLEHVPDVAARCPRVFSATGCSISLTTEKAFPHAIRTPNRAFSCGLHLLPQSGAVYVGATNNIFWSPQTRALASDVSFLLQCATEQLSQRLQSAFVDAIRIGNRPVSLDGFPLIGPTSVPGLFVATGTYRDGFHLSPLIARSIVSAAIDRDRFDMDSAFFPERLPIQPLDRETSAEIGLEYFVATAYERSIVIPQLGDWERRYRDMCRQRIAAIYDALGPFVLPPDFLWEADQFSWTAQLRALYERLSSAHGSQPATPRAAQPMETIS
jgi:glycine/D-amino acid oxidase-like deaminating enzyme